MKHLLYILSLLSCLVLNAQQKFDPAFFKQTPDGLMRYTEIGETYITRIIADGWFNDTTGNSRNNYHNPYELYSTSQKHMNDKNGFVFFKYIKGRKCNGLFIDSLFYNKNNSQIYFKGAYKNGMLEGKAEMYFTRSDGIYENGKLKSLGNFENVEVVGEWINYFPSGEVRDKCEYAKNIKFVQKVTSYFKNGSIEYISEFLQDGTRKYVNKFYADGKVLSSKILTKIKNEELFYNYVEYFSNGKIKTNGLIRETNMDYNKMGIWELYNEDGIKSFINYK